MILTTYWWSNMGDGFLLALPHQKAWDSPWTAESQPGITGFSGSRRQSSATTLFKSSSSFSFRHRELEWTGAPVLAWTRPSCGPQKPASTWCQVRWVTLEGCNAAKRLRNVERFSRKTATRKEGTETRMRHTGCPIIDRPLVASSKKETQPREPQEHPPPHPPWGFEPGLKIYLFGYDTTINIMPWKNRTHNLPLFW